MTVLNPTPERATRSSFSSLSDRDKQLSRHAGSASLSSSGGGGDMQQTRSSFTSSGEDMTQPRHSFDSNSGSSPSAPTPLTSRNVSTATQPAHHNYQYQRRGSTASQRGSICSRVSSLTRDSSMHSLDPLKIEISDLTHMVGRTTQQELLQSAFVRLLKQENLPGKRKELVLVHGNAGTGKTALVMDFKDAVTSAGTGHFCSGKFEQYETIATPYSGIVRALDDLCEAISVGQDKNHRRESLYHSMDLTRLKELTKLLPKLQTLLHGDSSRMKDSSEDDSDEDEVHVNPWERRAHELPSIFLEFLRALGGSSHPVILFFDDLQWADEGSIECIKTIIRDESLINFMIVSAFREEDITRRPYSIEGLGHSTADIQLENLSLSHVHDILSDLTGTPAVTDLAKIVVEKTYGNPFSIFQFLEMLQRKELLVFSFQTHKWIWDVEQIKSKTDVTQNVGHSLVQNVNKISREARKLLTLAAVIGFSFDPKVLELIATHLDLLETEYRDHLTNTVKGVIQDAIAGGLIHPDQTQAMVASQMELVEDGSTGSLKQSFYEETIQTAIQEAEVEGLIGKAVSRSRYKFSHDLVHKSFYENTTLDIERHKLHLQIGRVLRSFYSVRPEDDLLFAAVDHLNKGSHFLDNDDERIDLVQLNKKSSEKARARSALFSAANFSSKAIDLLKFGYDWLNHYDLLLHVYDDAAELNFACGRFDLSLRRCLEIHRHAKCLQDKLLASYIRVQVLFSQRKITEAINSCLSVLDSLGAPLERKPSPIQVLGEWRKVRKLMRGESYESLMKLPPMSDPIKRQTQRYMSLLVSMTFNAINNQLFPMVIMRMVTLALVHGACDYTPFAIAGYGTLCSVLGSLDDAFSYGQMAIKLCEGMKNQVSIPGTYVLVHSVLEHIRKPLLTSIEPLLLAYRVGVSHGEVQYAATCAAASSGIGLHCALPLKAYTEDLKNVCDQLKLLRQENMWALVVPYWQAALDLSGSGTEEERRKARDIFENYSAEMSGTTSAGQVGLMWRNYHMVSYVVCYIFNDFQSAKEMRGEMWRKYDVGPKSLHFMIFFELFFSGLLDVAIYRQKGSWSAWRRARAATKKIQRYVKNGLCNCLGMWLLLKAELHSLRRRHFDTTKRLYEDSMAAFAASGFIHFQAIANERAADYFKGQGKPRRMWQAYLRSSTQLYAEWGAGAKVSQLIEVHRMPARFSMGDTPCPVITIRGEKTKRFTPIEANIAEEDFMGSDFISSDLFT